MKAALLLVAAACQSGGEKPTPTPGSAVVVVAKPDAAAPIDAAVVADAMPKGPYVVAYDCSHMNAPFGEGGSVYRITYDLGEKTVETLSYSYGKEGGTAIKHQPTLRTVAPTRIAQLEAAIQKVLSGGPFKPEYPVPEGTRCYLRIAAHGASVFDLEKSNPQLKDPATDLIKLLGVPPT